jgi:uncharacterized protein (TIGR00297 family)
LRHTIYLRKPHNPVLSIIFIKMNPFTFQSTVTALIAALVLALRATQKRTLTRAGATVGFVVGFLLVSTGLRGFVLFFFYQLGSLATRYNQRAKAALDVTCAEASVRGARQVLAVSLIAVVLSLYHALVYGSERAFTNANGAQTKLACAVLAHHATSMGDTLASELGMLSKSPPVLIIKPWRGVAPGTNGGVTLFGTVCSLVGGAIIGLLTAAMDACSGIRPIQWMKLCLFGAMCGGLGSIVDSFMGATLQATYWNGKTKQVQHGQGGVDTKLIGGFDLLSNEQVNFGSLVVMTFLGGCVLGPWFFSL